MRAFTFATLTAFSTAARAAVVWNGSFNTYSSVSDFDKWSWSNEVGSYQWYIHGSQPTSHYLAFDPSYKNPALTSEVHGLKVTIDSTATWNSQMERTELIPQTTANLGTGQMYYHFSLMHSATNPPDSTSEHQIFFFESHFTELKYGVGSTPSNLVWMVQGVQQWATTFVAGTWYNFAYDINFSAGTVGLWASIGSAPLVKVANNIAAPTSTNSEDWHVGLLRIVNGPNAEDWYVSGVYIESGTITTAITMPSASSSTSPPGQTTSDPRSTVTSITTTTTTSQPTTTPPTTTTTTTTIPTSLPPTTTTPTNPTTTISDPLQTHYGQCGGTGYYGPTGCASPYTCQAIAPPYYYQCL